MLKRLELTAGELRFTALTKGQGPLVLCLHGFPDHPPTFRHLLPALGRAGYRAVAPWLRGYEPTSQPADRRFDVPALAGDVLTWLDELGAARAHVVGHDWGAAIGYCLGQTAPERLISLTTLAVPWLGLPLSRLLRRPDQLSRSSYMALFQLRRLSDRLLRAGQLALVKHLWRRWSPGWQMAPREWESLRQTLEAPGVITGALGYYRGAFDWRSPTTRRWLAQRGRPVPVPTLALTGSDDGCIDTRLFDGWPRAAFPAGLRVERLEGAGHFLHLERADRVNGLILDWIGRFA